MDLYNHFVNCVLRAKYLKSNGFDLSNFRLEQTLKEHRYRYSEKYYNYLEKPLSENLDPLRKTTELVPWELILMNLIGEYPNLRILDIGCGKGTISKIIAKNNNVTITTIDAKTIPIIKDAYSHTHYLAKWDSKSIENLEKNYYDIIICDVEPHGDEKLIYNHFLPFLKDIHIYLGLCIGYMIREGSYVFDNFVNTFETHIIDKFACYPYRNVDCIHYDQKEEKKDKINQFLCTRNTWLIMSKSSVQPINTISDYLFPSITKHSIGEKAHIDDDRSVKTFEKNSKRMKLFVDDLTCLEN